MTGKYGRKALRHAGGLVELFSTILAASWVAGLRAIS
jgi:hypothetical protein